MKANSVHSLQQPHLSWADGLALGLEMVGLGALMAWGWQRFGWAGVLLPPLAVSVLWARFLSPRATRPVTGLAWPLAKLAVFAVCALALTAVTGPLTAAAYFALALLGITLGGTR
ncbi:YrdB family protein [Deinococcus koreensis]|nr:YrdB family protein [Deinococcus koreensis]